MCQLMVKTVLMHTLGKLKLKLLINEISLTDLYQWDVFTMIDDFKS